MMINHQCIRMRYYGARTQTLSGRASRLEDLALVERVVRRSTSLLVGGIHY